MTSKILRPTLLVQACLVGLLLAPMAQAGLYKWVDANGQVHFSDTPKSSKAEQVDVSETRRLNDSGSKKAAPAATPSRRTAGGFGQAKPPPATRRSSLMERRDALRKKAAAEEARARKKAAAEALQKKLHPDRAAEKREKMRKKAIERCERLGMRKNCDSDEMIEKFRDLTPAERASRDAKRARAFERDERARRRGY